MAGAVEEIIAAVQKMYGGRRAALPVVIRDELGELFTDELFAAAFGVRGRPGWSPGRLELVRALQLVENLTDRQAAEAVRPTSPRPEARRRAPSRRSPLLRVAKPWCGRGAWNLNRPLREYVVGTMRYRSSGG